MAMRSKLGGSNFMPPEKRDKVKEDIYDQKSLVKAKWEKHQKICGNLA